jgi:hypothetical protein
LLKNDLFKTIPENIIEYLTNYSKIWKL